MLGGLDMPINKSLSVNYYGNDFPVPLAQRESVTKNELITEATILFTENDYYHVSMRDLANAIGITPASVYNHFQSKEDLLDAVLDLGEQFYDIYTDIQQKQIDEATQFSNILDAFFLEPKKMDNAFTCYAFSLIMQMQFCNNKAWKIYHDIFLVKSFAMVKSGIERSIANGWIHFMDEQSIDAVSEYIQLACLDWVNLATQIYMGRHSAIDPREGVARLEKFIENFGV
jgi:AcrR family transcriptional regulator